MIRNNLIPLLVFILVTTVTACTMLGIKSTPVEEPAEPVQVEKIDNVAEGTRLYEAGSYDDALTAYGRALESNPGNAEAHFGQGIIYHKRKNYDLAIQKYNETIRIDSSHAKAHFNLGRIYSYEKVDYVKAIYFMERYVELAPDDAFVPEAKKKIKAMKKKAYGPEDAGRQMVIKDTEEAAGKEDKADDGSLLDVVDELFQ